MIGGLGWVMTIEGLIGFALFILIAPLLRHWPRAWRWVRYRGSGSWPTLTATIKLRGVREESSGHGDIYRPYLDDSYFSDGEERTGSFKGDIYGSRHEAESELSEICDHPPVMVRVHPSKPGTSVLVLPD